MLKNKKVLIVIGIIVAIVIIIIAVVSINNKKAITTSNNSSNKSSNSDTQATTNKAISKDEILYLSNFNSYDNERQIVLNIASSICSAYNAYEVPQEVKIWDLDGQGRYLLNIKKVNTTTGKWENLNRAVGYVASEDKYYTNYSANLALGKGNYSDFDKVKSYLNWGEPLLSGNDL